MISKEEVYKYLENLGISYNVRDHGAAHTIAEAQEHWEGIEGAHCKNLFLRDKKGRRHFLILAEKDTPIMIRKLGEMLGNERLGFASEQRLAKFLGLKPGAVTPFGLLNDKENHVIVWIDENLKQFDKVNFHPNVNTATVTIGLADFEHFLASTGNSYQYMKF